MFRHLLKALLLTLVVCEARRNLQEEKLCENGTPIYEMYVVDGTFPTEKADCTYGVTIESGECRVVINDVKADSTGHICFNAASGECNEFDATHLTGSVSSHCGDDTHTEPINTLSNIEFNKQIPIETSILKMNIAVGYGCEGEKKVDLWKPEECKPAATEEKNETDEKKEEEEKKEEDDKKEEDNKNEPEENNQTEDKNTTEPENNTTEPEKNDTEPEKNEVEPEKNETEPEKNNTEPEKNEVEPEKNDTEPEKNETDNKNDTQPEKNETDNTNEQDNNATEDPSNNDDNTDPTQEQPGSQNNDTKQEPNNETSFSFRTELGLLELILGLFVLV